jgi:hypothetical protein
VGRYRVQYGTTYDTYGPTKWVALVGGSRFLCWVPQLGKKVSDGSLGTYYMAGPYYISRNKNQDSISIQAIPVICSLSSYGFNPFSFKIASFRFGSPKVGLLRRDGVVNWFLTEFNRT